MFDWERLGCSLALAVCAACPVGLAAGGEDVASNRPSERASGEAIRIDANAPERFDIAKAAAEVARASEAARQAAAELARAEEAARIAAERARGAEVAAEQARAAVDQAEADAVAAEEDAVQADRDVLLAGKDKKAVAEARAEAAQAHAVAAQARFAAMHARARADQLSRDAVSATQDFRQAAALRAAAAQTAAQASARQAAALRAYQAASLALLARNVASGEAAMKAGDYLRARERLEGVTALPQVEGSAQWADRAREILGKIEGLAAEELDQVKLLKLQGREPEALEVLKSILGKFSRTKAAEEAHLILANDPRIAATAELLAVEGLDRGGLYAEAAARYAELIKRFPESVQALKARLRLEAMQKDPVITTTIKEQSRRSAEAACPGWLALARSYLDNNLPDQARALLQKVVTNCPDSEYAAEARQALTKIGGEQENR